MEKLYRLLLCLYPADFRAAFSEEMLTTFRQMQKEKASLRFYVREFAGLLTSALAPRIKPVLTQTDSNDVAQIEALIQFHLRRTLYCIANHQFAGARFHAAEEDRTRHQLRLLTGQS